MKLTIVLLTAAFLQVHATGISQEVTFSGNDVPLDKVFAEVKKQTGFVFFYNTSILNDSKPISIKAENLPLRDFLDRIFINQPLTYSIENKAIILSRKSITAGLNPRDLSLQENPVTGIVRGPDGEPLAGANVMIKGTKHGTTTDNDGRFKISADEGNILQISAMGFGKKEIKINGQQQIVVALEIATSVLDEVQYTAYGRESKRFSVSNISSVKAVDIEKQPVQNVLLALQARVPGLFITQPSGLSGTGIKVRIQGQNSIRRGSNPLYVIDGVPIDAELPSTGVDGVLNNSGANYIPGGNPLNYLNPADIESIEVLKDADATAIYGSRAANGAILITTKKGKAGAMKLDVNMQAGIGRVARRLEMMNTRQYLDMRYEAFRNDNIDWRSPSVSANDLKVWDTTHYTDWQQELLSGKAHYTNLNASLSGGTNIVRYLVSGTYHKETTVFPFPDFADQKAAVHFNVSANNSNEKFRMQFFGNYMVDVNRLPQGDLTRAALLMEPNAPPLLNADGSINWAPDANGNATLGGSDVNVMIQKLQRYQNKTYNLISSLKVDYTVVRGLTIGTSVGYNFMLTNDYSPYPLSAVPPELRAGTKRGAAFGDRNLQTWIAEPQVNYRTKISKATIDVIIGSTFQEKTAVSNMIIGTGQLSDDLLDNINSAASIARDGGSSTTYKYTALFARTNINWSDKYIINVNARRDGSSRFGADNLFHNFGSVGAAWIFSQENFFKSYSHHISFGKLRGSYGTTGNDQIGDYQFMSLYNLSRTASAPYQGIVGLFPDGLPNQSLQWEETRKLQIGIDLGFWQDRLMINATFVRNRSSNQLLGYALPTQTGFNSYLVNFPATIQNKNWEFLISGKIIQKKNVSWTSSINLTMPRNKLIAYPDIAQSPYVAIYYVGEPIDVTAYYHFLEVAPGTGDYLYADNKGNPTLTPNPNTDRTVFISQFPKLYGGFDNTFTYKNFQVSFIFQYVQQNGYNDVSFQNGVRFPGMFAPGASNQPVTFVDRWQKVGDKNKLVAKYSTFEPPLHIISSDRRFADTWYLRLKNVAVSLDLREKWLNKAHMKNLRLYLHAQNLLTFTNYKGLDPETQSLSSLPPLQLWTGGIQLGL